MMNKRLIPLVASLSLLALAGTATGQEPKPDSPPLAAPGPALPDPVAVVNGVAIPRALLNIHLDQRRQQGGEVDDKTQRALIEALVAEELLVQEAAKQDLLAKDPQLATQVDVARRNLLATAVVRQMLDQRAAPEEDYQKEYQTLLPSLAKKEYKARHILVDTEDKAKKLIGEIKAGGDFSALAKTNSSDSSAENGGDLGWFTADIMPPDFGQAVAKLEKGKITEEPIKTRFGWHVVILDDSRDATPPSLNEMRPRIGQLIQERAINDYLKKLREGSQVQMK